MRADLRKPGRSEKAVRLVMLVAAYCPRCSEHLGDLPMESGTCMVYATSLRALRLAEKHEPNCPKRAGLHT